MPSLNAAAWAAALEGDIDNDFLMQGILHGFDIVNPNTTFIPTAQRNHSSANTNPDIVCDHVQKEIQLGHYIVCHDDSVLPDIISPLGLVPKSDGGHRLIHDCSAPAGKSLNSYAVDFDKCKYESVDSAVAMLHQGYYMAKVDIKAAYRSVAIKPSNFRATGLRWCLGNKLVTMVDTCLPFGAKASPTIFHRLSQSIKRIMACRGFQCIFCIPG